MASIQDVVTNKIKLIEVLLTKGKIDEAREANNQATTAALKLPHDDNRKSVMVGLGDLSEKIANGEKTSSYQLLSKLRRVLSDTGSGVSKTVSDVTAPARAIGGLARAGASLKSKTFGLVMILGIGIVVYFIVKKYVL